MEAGERPDSVSGNWVRQLVKSNFRVNDPSIHYPRFPRFCVNVYNWGDRTFNSYDTSYVVGTGRNWKTYLKSYNWSNSYFLHFSRRNSLHMISDIYADCGPTICFMALSLGYEWNLNRWLHTAGNERKSFNFNFCCALFSADYTFYRTKGGVSIKKFGDYHEGQSLNIPFDNITQEFKRFDLYYFFNHRRYSQAAAYSYSKYQLKSAGTWIMGFNYNHQKIAMDFSFLSPDIMQHLPDLELKYMFHYNEYGVMGGYGYNWVFRPKWLFNITALPSVGYKHSYVPTTSKIKDLFCANIKMMSSVTYNHRALFASLVLKFDGHLNMGAHYKFFNAMESASFLVGMRF